ncbi:MAG: hypothetical protein U1E30_03015 [Rhodoblastus sp.]
MQAGIDQARMIYDILDTPASEAPRSTSTRRVSMERIDRRIRSAFPIAATSPRSTI